MTARFGTLEHYHQRTDSRAKPKGNALGEGLGKTPKGKCFCGCGTADSVRWRPMECNLCRLKVRMSRASMEQAGGSLPCNCGGMIVPVCDADAAPFDQERKLALDHRCQVSEIQAQRGRHGAQVRKWKQDAKARREPTNLDMPF